MDVCPRFFRACVVLCVGSGLATGLITRQRSPTVFLKIHNSRFILLRNRPQGLIRNVEEEEEEEEGQ
jgi:hypothetical protein